MSEMSPSETPLNEDSQTPDWSQRYCQQTMSNFVVLASMYEDKQFLEDLDPYLRDKEDLKRVIHALLLCEGSKGGWPMTELKTKVKEMKGFKDTKDVDKFVKEMFHYDTFDQLIKKAKDIATVDEFGNVHPVLDDTNREIYEDAVASVKNKEDKERKKDERIARSLEHPDHIVGFYRGVNRIRKAILNTLENYRTTDRENALCEINEKVGTGSKVVGVNYNFVCTEYERLYGTKLDDKECKIICGRSTLSKGLNQGQGPQCLIDTITMENKCDDLAKGMYIGLKSVAREFTEEEIQRALNECVQRNSNKQSRGNKWAEKDAKSYRQDVSKDVSELTRDRLKLQLNEQLQSHRSASASDTPPSTPISPDAPVAPSEPVPTSVPEPAPASVPPPNQSTATNVEWDTRTMRETQPQAPPPTTQKMSERERRAMEFQEADSDDLHSEDGYSDEDEEDKEKRVEGNELRRIERQRRDKGRQSDDEFEFRAPSNPPPPVVQPSPPPVQEQPVATPSRTPMATHDEVPYGELPPATHVIHYDDGDDDERKDEMDAEEVLNQALASTSASRLTPTGARHNKWEDDDEPATSVDRRLFTPPPQEQPPTVQQPSLRMAPSGGGVFAPKPIPPEAYTQPAFEQPIQQQPLEQLQPSYEEEQRAYDQEQQQPQYDHQQMQYSPAPYEEQQQPLTSSHHSTRQTPIPPQHDGMNPPMQPHYPYDQQPQEYPPSSQDPHYSPVFPPQQQPPQGYPGPNSRQSTPCQPQYDPESTAASYSQHTYSQGPYQQFPHDGSTMHPDPQFPPPPPQSQYQQPPYSPYQQQPQYPPVPVYPNGAPAPNQSGYGHPGYGSDRTPSPVINVYNHIASPRAGPEYHAPPSALPSHDPRHGVPPPINHPSYPPQHYGAHPGAPRDPRDQWHGHGASTPVDEYGRPYPYQPAPAPRSASGSGGERHREELRRGDSSYEDALLRKIKLKKELAELEEELERERERNRMEQHRPPSSSHHGRPRDDRQSSIRRRVEERSTPSPLGDFDDEYQKSMQRQMQPPSRGFGMTDEERRRGEGRNEGRGNRSREGRDYHQQPPRAFGDPNSGMRTDRSYDGNGYERGYASGRGPSPRDDRERRDPYGDRGDRGFGRRETREEPPNTRPPRVLENPVAASTPLNRSRDESLWGFFHQLQSPKERIRWLVISIVKCMKDQNRQRLSEGRSGDYQLIEMGHLMTLVEQGSGNEMDLFTATSEYLNSSDPFYKFLREMVKDNLVAMYTGQHPTSKMNSPENSFFIVDPFTPPPPHFGLRRVQA